MLAPDDPRWINRDDGLTIPEGIRMHRARYLGPRGRRPTEELYGLRGLRRALKRVQLFGRRLLVPDENVTWVATAIPAAIRIARRERIDIVVTTSPPPSVHLVGLAVKRLTGARWVADLRDPLVSHPHRRIEKRLVRAKELGPGAVAATVARNADGIVAVSGAIAEEMRARSPGSRVVTIASGADFDDFEGLDYRRGTRFRVTHAGSFVGKRDPRPFLRALERVEGVDARFLGDSRAADREWVEGRPSRSASTGSRSRPGADRFHSNGTPRRCSC